MSTSYSSDVDTALPVLPMTKDPELYQELSQVYFAIQVLQREVSSLRARVASLEAYNIAHP